MSRGSVLRLTLTGGVLALMLVGVQGPVSQARPNGPPPTFPCEQPGQSTTCYSPLDDRRALGLSFLKSSTNGTGMWLNFYARGGYPESVLLGDITHQDSLFSLRPLGSLQFFQPDGPVSFSASNSLDNAEAIDLSASMQLAHAIAPDANIRVFEFHQTGPLPVKLLVNSAWNPNKNINLVLAPPKEDVNGDFCDSPAQLDSVPWATWYEFTGTGDSKDGSANACPKGKLPLSDPPAVTVVGGLTEHMTWNPTLDDFSGFGTARVWNDSSGHTLSWLAHGIPEPLWQRVHVKLPWRSVPDVSFNEDPGTGHLFYFSPQATELVAGGSAEGIAAWAGVVALAKQACPHPLGHLNLDLYTLEHTHPMSFHDITTGGIPGLSARTGYDRVSGVGAPNARYLVDNLCKFTTK